MRYRVDYLPAAQRDVAAILRWIAERSASGAANWYRTCMATIERLETNADSCGLAAEDVDHQGDTIRESLFRTRHGRTFRIVFVIRGSVVSVLHVRSSDQDVIPQEQFRLPDE
jgi:plasmid stabilization system protein ParE